VPATTYVPLNPRVLGWAIKDSGLSIDDLAAKVSAPARAIREWVQGKSAPSKTQFARLAVALGRPTAFFFRREPPLSTQPTVHLRAPTGYARRPVTPHERQAIAQAQGLQNLMRWLLVRRGASPVPVNGSSTQDSPEDAASRFRDRLGVSVDSQRSWSDAAAALRAWRRIAENAGIIVLQLELGRAGIRGFTIANEFAPIVAVNSSFSVQARIFSLLHEVGHLLVSHNSACLGFARPTQQHDRDERWAERFAASFLLPELPVRNYLQSRHFDMKEATGLAAVRALSSSFKVSARATALRLVDLNLAKPELYGQVAATWKVIDYPEGSGGGGQPTPDRRLSQFGLRPTTLIIDAAERGDVTQLDAMRYLRLKLHDYEELQQRLGKTA
jgi:Zn-dependent peptidase ImmA (M78 family)/transcriptional regulator with XRE-family HTH domain